MFKDIFSLPRRAMPYSADHKLRVRKRIVRSARDLFNRRGYGAVRIDDVMAAAGLTRGGFYAHFKNKAELYREAVGFILEEHPAREWEGVDFDLTRSDAARVIVDAYLSPQHLTDVARSCPLVTQAADAARGDADVKAVYAQVLSAMTRALKRSFLDAPEEEASQRALAVAALCVGGLTLARAMSDLKEAAAMLQASRTAALNLIAEPFAAADRSRLIDPPPHRPLPPRC